MVIIITKLTLILTLILTLTLTPNPYQTVCNKLASEILARYLLCITKQKKISEEATQQLLLDTYTIKALLLHLPTLEGQESGGNAGACVRAFACVCVIPFLCLSRLSSSYCSTHPLFLACV